MQKEKNREEEVLTLSDKYEPLFEWLDCPKFLDKNKTIPNPLYHVNTVVITGGRYSQKSFGIGTFSGIATKDFNHRILYTRYTLTSAKDSIIPEFEEKLTLLNCHDDFKVTKDSIKGIHNDSKIVFKGIKTGSGNQTASLKSLKNFSIFILDEAEEMPNFTTWDKIKKSMRALDVRNLSILSLNPATEEHWIHEELFEGKGVEAGFNGIVGNVLYIHSTYRDIEREFISDDTWQEYEELRLIYEAWKEASPKEKAEMDPKLVKKAKYFLHTIMGGWLSKAEGVIFEDWETGEFMDNGKAIFGQDYGFSVDPTTLIKVCIEKSLKKIYLKEYLYRPKMTTSQIYDFNKQVTGGTLIIGDSSEPRLIEELRKKGNNIKGAEKGPGSVSGGIARMLDYTLVVDPDSKNLKKELNNYVWHDKKSNMPIDDWNHLIDPIRYVVLELTEAPNNNLRQLASLI